MDITIGITSIALIAIAIYILVKTMRAIGRVGFLSFSKALLILLTSFVVTCVKAVGSVLQGVSQDRESVTRNPDPFLSPMEKSPDAQSPLTENPIDNPEGYYLDG